MELLQTVLDILLELTKCSGPVVVGIAGVVFGYLLNHKILKQEQHEDELL